MKKTLLSVASVALVALATLTALTSCHKLTQEEKEQRIKESNERITQRFKKVEYEGHTYILYEVASPQNSRAGLTHDPACDLCNP